MTPDAFCTAALEDLRPHSADKSWVRGARALCDMYRQTDAQRFEQILEQLASGKTNSAVADGGKWLLARWRATRSRPPT